MSDDMTPKAEPTQISSTHMAIPTENFREIVNLIRVSSMTGELGFRLLTILGTATGANFTPPAAPSRE